MTVDFICFLFIHSGDNVNLVINAKNLGTIPDMWYYINDGYVYLYTQLIYKDVHMMKIASFSESLFAIDAVDELPDNCTKINFS